MENHHVAPSRTAAAKSESRTAATAGAAGQRAPIVTDRIEIVAARIDSLIAAGKLAEADRPRCVYWQDFFGVGEPMNAEQLALVRAQKEIANRTVPDTEAAWVWSMARLLECLAPEANSETGDSL